MFFFSSVSFWVSLRHFRALQVLSAGEIFSLSKSFRWDAKDFFVASFPIQNAPTNYLRRFDLWKTGFFIFWVEIWPQVNRSFQEVKGMHNPFRNVTGMRFWALKGCFFWLKLCVTSNVRQHSGLASRYHARDSWSMQMQELKQLYSPATKDPEKRKIWHYDFLQFTKKMKQMSRKYARFFSLESCGFTKVHDNLQSSVPWWFFKYRSWNNLGNI